MNTAKERVRGVLQWLSANRRLAEGKLLLWDKADLSAGIYWGLDNAGAEIGIRILSFSEYGVALLSVHFFLVSVEIYLSYD